MNLVIATSTIADGNMLIRDDKSNKEVIINRTNFLAKNNIDIKQTSMVSVTYDSDNYCRYSEISSAQKGVGMSGGNIFAADALITREPNHALFLPLADCAGVVIFDPTKQILMLSHLGRHSIEQNGAYESVKYLIDNYECDPKNLKTFISPTADKENYPLFKFDEKSIKEVISEQLLSADVLIENIVDNPIDTTKDAKYYSHSEFLKGNRSEDGRFAIVAIMKD